MTVNEKLKKISDGYYNAALKKAQERDLSGAAADCKESLRFYKYQRDARNLLGLIFYETGETADALCQWVVSCNLSPEENPAVRYLDELQKRTGELELAAKKIKKFNQALYQAQHGGEDYAIIQLQHLVSEYPSYVKAQLLLSMLYLKAEDYRRAGRAVMAALKTDRFHPLGLRLLDEVKRRTGRDKAERKKYFGFLRKKEKPEEEEAVLLPEKPSLPSGKAVLFILTGLAAGILFYRILLLPPLEKQYKEDSNRKLVEINRELSNLHVTYDELVRRYDELSSEYSEASKRLFSFEQGNADFTSLYQKLSSIKYNYDSGDREKAIEDYLSIDINLITDEPLTGLYTDIDRTMKNKGFAYLTEKGTENWNGGRKDEAERYYNMALSIRPDDPETLYLKARLLQSSDRITEANRIFDVIVSEHPDSIYAERSVAARGY